MIGFIGQGNIRHVEIFWTEKVEQTIVFQDIDGETQIKAIKGVKGDDWNMHKQNMDLILLPTSMTIIIVLLHLLL